MLSEKPRSMKSGARNVLRSNDSASLWNCTLSPGWTDQESDVLRKALMKFGIGNWSKIIESGCLPGKTNAQMNLQLQRLLGQQSTAEFAGLHIDPKVVGAKNALIQGPDIKRKNGCIVNTGGKVSREELKRRIVANKAAYEIPESEWKSIVLPKIVEVNERYLFLCYCTSSHLPLFFARVQACIAKIQSKHPDRLAQLKMEESRSPSPVAKSPVPVANKSPALKSVTPMTKPSTRPKRIPDTDGDLAMALALQKEEDERAGISPMAYEIEEFDDEDDFVPKKRKVQSRRR
ncbi:hypothetical protein A0J61_06856 [Choanephora cucurbitarum]|uniref:Myb-like domain-containing protein n=1 Tax=Choanephora cucurbitarum TaxID=101091 RepID=A0A1C7N7I8_9FUNG|nr:hypothetical protein A0J61_06856 [Choanephora cucurbitarum]